MADPIPPYSFTSPRRQLFSFPPDMIASMLKNPSSSIGLKKLYQTCKYFYGKRPILITYEMVGKEINDDDSPRLTLSRNGRNVLGLRTPIWLMNKVCFDNIFVPNHQLFELFRPSVEDIIVEHSELPYDFFALLTSEKMVKTFYAYNSYVYHADESKATIDEILECLPNINNFAYPIDEKCSYEVLMKLNKIKLNSKFKYIKLNMLDIHPTFDLNLLCEFIMKNSNADTYTYMHVYMYPSQEWIEKWKIALQKLDPKWKNEANYGMKEFFEVINRNWEEEIGK